MWGAYIAPPQTPDSPGSWHFQHSHLCVSSAQVIAELSPKPSAEARGKLRVQGETLMQPCQLQTLQDAICQPLHICIGLHHLLTLGQLTANQITLPWREGTEVRGCDPSAPEMEQNGAALCVSKVSLTGPHYGAWNEAWPEDLPDSSPERLQGWSGKAWG